MLKFPPVLDKVRFRELFALLDEYCANFRIEATLLNGTGIARHHVSIGNIRMRLWPNDTTMQSFSSVVRNDTYSFCRGLARKKIKSKETYYASFT